MRKINIMEPADFSATRGYMYNFTEVRGRDMQSFTEFCKNLDQHSESVYTDFEDFKVCSYLGVNHDPYELVYIPFDSSGGDIIRRNGQELSFTTAREKIQKKSLINAGISDLSKELIYDDEMHTVFISEDDDKKNVFMVGDAGTKTFQLRMPVNDWHSSIPRDMHLALKLGEQSEKSDDKNGLYLRTRVVKSNDAVYRKIVGCFSINHDDEVCSTFTNLADAIQQIGKTHSDVKVFKTWSFDNRCCTITVTVKDETDLFKKMYQKTNYNGVAMIPAYTFRFSDTGHVASSVTPGCVLYGSLVEFGQYAQKISKNMSWLDGFEKASLKNAECIQNVMSMAWKKIDVSEDTFSMIVDTLLQDVHAQGRGVSKKQINEMRMIANQEYASAPVKEATMLDIIILAVKSFALTTNKTDYSEQQLSQHVLGDILLYNR